MILSPRGRHIFLCLMLVLALFLPLWGQEPPELRLEDGAEPLRYAVELTIDPRQEEFSGRIVIDLRFHRETSLLWLNATNLSVERAVLEKEGATLPVEIRDGNEHSVGFAFAEAASLGEAQLEIHYRGRINEKTTAGIFKAKDEDDWYVLTQFESFEARRAFPCFDEPGFKTPWQITLRIPPDHSAFTNTPELRQTQEADGWRRVEFAESKPLPSYLVALAVGPFEVVSARAAGRNETPVRIITPRGKASHAKYAAQVTPEVLEWLEEYFGIPYPYEKLDSIAVPVGFGFGAMENAGLVTYIQPLLLADPEKDSIQRQRGYYETCAHELAHQWFGDLVTPQWWDDLWLNEAFASWMSSKLVQHTRPEWNEDLGAVRSRLGVMGRDALISARRIRNPISSYGDIMSAFDRITYSKGQAVIRMFEAWVGDDAFRDGVRRYLKRYAWGNATAGDFLDEISSDSSPNLSAAFGTFLNQGGVPLVSVALRCEENSAVVALRQKRALPAGSLGTADQTWMIPVCARYEAAGGEVRECFLLRDAQAEWPLAGAAGCPAWISANANGDGYYHADYTDALLKTLLAGGGSALPPTERLTVAGDVFAGFEMGTVDGGTALALVPELAQDPERSVVGMTIRMLGQIWPHMVGAELQPNYVRFLQQAYGERAHALGWLPRENEEAEDRLLRNQVVFLIASRGEDAALATEARELALRWLEDSNALPPEIISPVLSTAAYHGDRDLFERYLAAVRSTRDRGDRQRLYGALGSFRDAGIASDALDLVLSEDFDLRESLGILWATQATPETRRLRFEFVRKHFDALVERLPADGGFQLGSRLTSVAGVFCSETEAREAEGFFGPRMQDFHGGEQALAETLENVRLCGALKNVQQQSVAEFLRGY